MLELICAATGAGNDGAALDAAIGFAAAHGMRLVVAIPSPIPTPMTSPWGVTADTVLTEMFAMVEREAAARAEALRERLGRADVTWEVRIDEPRFVDPAIAFAQQARYADLSILGKPEGNDASIGHAYFSAALFESGRPVLVVPTRKYEAKRTRRIVVAWKPAREATRAIHDAIALFKPEAVDIVVVDPAQGPGAHGPDPGADIAAHLARRGQSVTVTPLPSAGNRVAGAVLLHAAQTGADMVVAGGYGHARLREWALGGATRDLLEGLAMPVLFSH